jgi:hypothetical protein
MSLYADKCQLEVALVMQLMSVFLGSCSRLWFEVRSHVIITLNEALVGLYYCEFSRCFSFDSHEH